MSVVPMGFKGPFYSDNKSYSRFLPCARAFNGDGKLIDIRIQDYSYSGFQDYVILHSYIFVNVGSRSKKNVSSNLQVLGCEFYFTKNFTGCERRMHLFIYLSSG